MATNPMKVVRVAYIVAFLIAGLVALGALTGPIVILPFALIPLVAGIGILRRRVWSACGLALYEAAQLFVLLIVFSRSESTIGLAAIVVQAVLTVVLVLLFVFTGRSLAAGGAPRGLAWPWIAIATLTTIPLLFVQAFANPTGSMENTLLIGDRFLVRRFPKPSVERGDLIAFKYPIDRSQAFVKRVIGLPGDRLKIVEKIVYVNGAVLKEPYVIHKSPYPDSYRDNLPSEPSDATDDAARAMLKNNVVNGEVVVPQGKYFVLGDNRDNSLDSRYWGFVGAADLIGKPILIYDSEDETPPLSHRVRWNRLFTIL
jgi:signal peptidase I